MNCAKNAYHFGALFSYIFYPCVIAGRAIPSWLMPCKRSKKSTIAIYHQLTKRRRKNTIKTTRYYFHLLAHECQRSHGRTVALLRSNRPSGVQNEIRHTKHNQQAEIKCPQLYSRYKWDIHYHIRCFCNFDIPVHGACGRLFANVSSQDLTQQLFGCSRLFYNCRARS